MGDDGLRHTPESCFPCIYKTDCLRAALKKTEGIKVQEEKLERAEQAGMMGFFERWSRKKALHAQKQKLKKN